MSKWVNSPSLFTQFFQKTDGTWTTCISGFKDGVIFWVSICLISGGDPHLMPAPLLRTLGLKEAQFVINKLEDHPRTCKRLGDHRITMAIWKGSHNPILRGQKRSPWLLTNLHPLGWSSSRVTTQATHLFSVISRGPMSPLFLYVNHQFTITWRGKPEETTTSCDKYWRSFGNQTIIGFHLTKTFEFWATVRFPSEENCFPQIFC